MTRVLVVHGAGMDLRGKTQVDVFGPLTLPEYDEHIRGYAADLGVGVEIFHSNIESEVINRIQQACEEGVNALVINPAGYIIGHPKLVAAIDQTGIPTFEVHMSNPARRARTSEIAGVARGVVTGFGIFGYYLALRGVEEMIRERR